MTTARLCLFNPTCRYQVPLSTFGHYLTCGKPASWALQDGNVFTPLCSTHKAVTTRQAGRYNRTPLYVPIEAREEPA